MYVKDALCTVGLSLTYISVNGSVIEADKEFPYLQMPADALAYQGSFNLLNPTVNLRGLD